MFRTFNKLLSLIAGTLMLATVSAKADVVVASAGPMSGQYASFGAQLKAGAEMWLKHVNKKGGINGEKVKFLYLKKPNIIQENVISFIQDFPNELGLNKYVDYDLQFDKSFVEPLKAILDAIGWNVEKTVNLELFFS